MLEPFLTEGCMQTVQVDLGDRSYPIYIGQELLGRSDLAQLLHGARR